MSQPNEPTDATPKTEESRFIDVVVGRTRFVGKVTKIHDLEAVERTERFIVDCLLQRMPVLGEPREGVNTEEKPQDP